MFSTPSINVGIVSWALINVIILGYHVPASAIRGPARSPLHPVQAVPTYIQSRLHWAVDLRLLEQPHCRYRQPAWRQTGKRPPHVDFDQDFAPLSSSVSACVFEILSGSFGCSRHQYLRVVATIHWCLSKFLRPKDKLIKLLRHLLTAS